MEEFKGLNAISHHLLERISDKGDSPLRRFRARTDSLFDFDGGNSRLIAMQRVRRIFGLCSSIFIKNMAAIIERVYQVSKYEGRERENQWQWHLARAECAFLAPAAAFHIPYNLKLDRLNRAE